VWIFAVVLLALNAKQYLVMMFFISLL